MKKHPSAFKVCGHLVALVESVKDTPVTLFEGTKNLYNSCISFSFPLLLYQPL